MATHGKPYPLRRSLDIHLQHFGREHPETAGGLVGLASVLKDQVRYSEAEPLLLEARQTLESLVGEEHPDWLKVNRRLVELYRAWGQPEKGAKYRLE